MHGDAASAAITRTTASRPMMATTLSSCTEGWTCANVGNPATTGVDNNASPPIDTPTDAPGDTPADAPSDTPAATDTPTPTSAPVPYAADYNSTPPTAWVADRPQTYAITVTNTGSETWNATGNNPVHLGVHFGTESDGVGDGWSTDQRFPLDADVPPGASQALTITVNPPATGSYVLRARMVKENEAWFDQIQKTAVAVLPARLASYDSAPPTDWTTGQTRTYAITVTNGGGETWNATGDDPVRLGIHFGTDSDGWGDGWATDQRYTLQDDVPPGASRTLTVTVTAPTTAGSYTLRARMVKENEAWFDQIQKTAVTVGDPPPSTTPVPSDTPTATETPLPTDRYTALNSGGETAGRFTADADADAGNSYQAGDPIDTSAVADPAPPAVYQSERWGNFTYTIPGLTPGATYKVRLHFAEIFFDQPGQRVFDVAINGTSALTNFDIVAAAGGKDKAIVKEFSATADGDGRIAIAYSGVVNNAKSSGIELVFTGAAPSPTATSTATDTPADTATLVPSDTPTTMPTDTATPMPSDTPPSIPSDTPTAAPTSPGLPGDTVTATSAPSDTPTPPAVPSNTATAAPSDTATAVATVASATPSAVPPTRVSTLPATDTPPPFGAALPLTGIITTVAGIGSAGYSGDGGPPTQAQLSLSSSFAAPYSSLSGIAIDTAGNTFIADTGNNRVREIVAATGMITTVAGIGSSGFGGDGGPATQAQLHGPTGVAVDAVGDLYIADSGNNRVREIVAATGIITTVAGTGAILYGSATMDGIPAAQAALDNPQGLTVDRAGDLYIAEEYNDRVREVIAATGIITTVAGKGFTFNTGGSGDGGPATQAGVIFPQAVALDGAGNLYIAEAGDARVREVIASTGIITTVAGDGSYMCGDFCYTSGVFPGPRGSDGGPATQVDLNDPQGMTVDKAGNLYIADSGHSDYWGFTGSSGNNVREVLAGTGIITTVVGTSSAGYNGDGQAATQAQVNGPDGLAFDDAGNLYIADSGNNRVREVVNTTGEDIVQNANDGGAGSLRDTIARANAGDTIVFAPGLGPITLTSGELLITKTLTISGPKGGAQTISGGGQSRVFEVSSDAQVSLANLTITDGRAPAGNFAPYGDDPIGSGGGVLNRGALTISDSTISGNIAAAGGSYCGGGYGGGIANLRTLTITSSIISDNTAGTGGPGCDGGDGGGVANVIGGSSTIISTTISDNSAGDGGPHWNDTSHNYYSRFGGSGGNGGGIANDGGGALTISASAVISNISGSGGRNADGSYDQGGIGGGISNTTTSWPFRENATIRNSTIANNRGLYAGGGIANGGIMAISNSTIMRNSSTPSQSSYGGYGGGLFGVSGGDDNPHPFLITISDTIVAGNTARYYGPDCEDYVSARYSLIQDTSGCGFDSDTTHDITGTDPLLGPLQDNGGPTYTMAPQPNSLVINYIPAASCEAGADQRGFPRPKNNGTRCDIGAVESVAPPSSPTATPSPTDTPSPTPTSTPTLPSGDTPWRPHYRVRLSDHLSASVDLADGHVDVHADGMRIPGLGPDLALDHTWDSNLAQEHITGATGQGWQSSLSPSVGGALTGTVMFTDTTGATWPFTATGAVSDTMAYSTSPGLPWRLTASSIPTTGTASYTLTNILTDDTLTFDGQGRFLADIDAYGNQNALAYADDGPPSALGNSGGRALTLSYTDGGLLSEVRSPQWQSSSSGGAPAGQHVTYGYNSSQQLTSITWGAGTRDAQTAHFAYDGVRLTTITTPGGHAWTLAYDDAGQLVDLISPASDNAPSWYTDFTYGQYDDGTSRAWVVQGYGSTNPVTTTYDLDPQGQATGITDGNGALTQLAHDADHDVTRRTDANNHTTTYAYRYVGPDTGAGIGSLGLVTETVHPAPNPPPDSADVANGAPTPTPLVTRYRYDPATGDLIEIDRPNGGVVRYRYTHHAVTSVAERVGNGPTTWRGALTTYDALGLVSSTIDGRGVTTDASGAVTPNDQTALYTRRYTYDDAGDLRTASSPPLTITASDGSQQSDVVATSVYTADLDGDVQAVALPGGETTTYSYDALGRLLGVTQPPVSLWDGHTVNPTTAFHYDGDGHPDRVTDPTGTATRRAYDALGRLTQTVDPVGATTTYFYSAVALTDVQDPLGHVTHYDQDAAGRGVAATDPLGQVTRYDHDPVGNTVVITSPLDASGAGSVRTLGYDALDEPVTDTVAGVGEPTPSAPQTSLTTFDDAGAARRRQDPAGNVGVYAHDLAGRPLTTTLFLDRPGAPRADQSYTYDPADNLTNETDFNERAHALAYDGANRLTAQVDTCPTCHDAAPIVTTPGYDRDGRPTWLAQQEGAASAAYTATYNAAGWLTSEADGAGQVTYDYDAAGRPRAIGFLGGGTLTAAYDAAGRVTGLGEDVGRTTPLTSTFTFDDAGRPLTTTLPNGLVEARAYDAAGRLTRLEPRLGAIDTTYSYARTPLGQTSAITTDHGGGLTNVESLHTDPRGRLDADYTSGDDTLTRFHYNPDGNLTQVDRGSPRPLVTPGPIATYAYAYTGVQTPTGWLPNELVSVTTAAGATRYGYDHSGDTTDITHPDGSADSLYYDALGRLRGAVVAAGPRGVAITYNAHGRRASYTVLAAGAGDQPPPPLFQETFGYRGDRVGQVAITGTAATPIVETFTYRPDGSPLELLVTEGGATNRYWYVLDGQGSVVALTDARGLVVCDYTYDAWGAPLTAHEDTGVHQPLRYCGYWFDGWDPSGSGDGSAWDTGALPWYWLGARAYDPALRRFLQPDPSSQDGVRSYAYCHDDPADCADPSGLSEDDGEGDGAGGGVAGSAGGTLPGVAQTYFRGAGGQQVRGRNVVGVQEALPGFGIPSKVFVDEPLAVADDPNYDYRGTLQLSPTTSRGVYRFISQASPADDAGFEAVYEADNALQSLQNKTPAAVRGLTVATGYISGRLRIAINDNASPKAAQFFKGLFGSDFIQIRGKHGEDALYLAAEQEAALTGQAPADVLEAIGISRVSGLCPNCQSTFSMRDVPVYVPGNLVTHDLMP